jgi:hypothetical protein
MMVEYDWELAREERVLANHRSNQWESHPQ